MNVTLTMEQAELLLSAIMRAEHKTTGLLTHDEYWAVVVLTQVVNAPGFITEYFARKANV